MGSNSKVSFYSSATKWPSDECLPVRMNSHGLPRGTTNTGTHLGDPQRTADVDPLGPTAGRLHCSTFLGTQQTLGLNPQGTRPAQPAALWDLENSVTGL